MGNCQCSCRNSEDEVPPRRPLPNVPPREPLQLPRVASLGSVCSGIPDDWMSDSEEGDQSRPCSPSLQKLAAATLQKILALFSEDRLMDANLYLERAEQQLPAHLLSSGAWADNQPTLARLRERVRKVRRMRKDLNEDDGWTQLRSFHGVRTCYRQEKDTNYWIARVEGTVESPALMFLALLREVDLWHHWIPRPLGLGLAGAPDVYSVAGKTDIGARVEVKMPWPLANRDCAMAVSAVDCMKQDQNAAETRQVVLLVEDDHGPDVPDVPPGYQRMSLEGTGIVVTPYYEGRSGVAYVQVLIRADFKMEVPDWVQRAADAAFRNLAFLLLETLRKHCLLIQSKPLYMDRVHHPRSPFYPWLRGRINDEMPEEGAKMRPADDSLAEVALVGPDALLWTAVIRQAIVAAGVAVAVYCSIPDGREPREDVSGEGANLVPVSIDDLGIAAKGIDVRPSSPPPPVPVPLAAASP
eukprot:TRINITY_DN24442_c0_g1_i1.p1 TRINITY_DN24442_c0_g1~~TRINITY_DN24442_c0_g1_i1.p1  ORF type:complete len:469 (+),score=129.15 TRINITY_DN24442_c0_g1_i1:116-1522(+)